MNERKRGRAASRGSNPSWSKKQVATAVTSGFALPKQYPAKKRARAIFRGTRPAHLELLRDWRVPTFKLLHDWSICVVIDSGLVETSLGGYKESRRCSRDTYPESYITQYSSIRRLYRSTQSIRTTQGLHTQSCPPKAYRGTSLIRNSASDHCRRHSLK